MLEKYEDLDNKKEVNNYMKKKSISCWIDEDKIKIIEDMSESDKRSKSFITRELIELGLARYQEMKPEENKQIQL